MNMASPSPTKLVGQHGDEHDVVDSQDDLEECERRECDPNLWVGEKF
jgi:hypothetical protein